MFMFKILDRAGSNAKKAKQGVLVSLGYEENKFSWSFGVAKGSRVLEMNQ